MPGLYCCCLQAILARLPGLLATVSVSSGWDYGLLATATRVAALGLSSEHAQLAAVVHHVEGACSVDMAFCAMSLASRKLLPGWGEKPFVSRIGAVSKGSHKDFSRVWGSIPLPQCPPLGLPLFRTLSPRCL